MISFEKLQWLFPIAVTLHNAEEAITMPRWTSQHHLPFSIHPPGAPELRFALLVLTVAAFVVTYFSHHNGKQSLSAYLTFGSIITMLANVFLPHLPATLAYRSHTPGVITAVCVNLPLASLLVWVALREQWVSGKKAWFFAIAVPLIVAATIPMLFWIGKSI